MEKKVHLFNCDSLFNLDSVESLFTSEVSSKLGFNISIEKHYFKLSQVSEMTESTVPGLQIDLAVFVIQANESRLSINEDNAGIGYAKIYRALVRATGEAWNGRQLISISVVFDTYFVIFYHRKDMSQCNNLITDARKCSKLDSFHL